MYKCKLCQIDTDKFVKSHIIARSMHTLGAATEDTTKGIILSSDYKSYPKKSPHGIYDRFLCAACEKIFQSWEDYALEIFKKAYEFSLPTVRTHIELNGYDYHKLKLFFISVLWRADASDHYMYRQVDVGLKHRESLRRMLLDKKSGDWQEYAVYLERFNSDKSYVSGMCSPLKGKLEDILFYTFYIAGFKIHIKCDSRKAPEKYSHVFLMDSGHSQIPLIPFEGSQEFQEFTKLVNRPNNSKVFS